MLKGYDFWLEEPYMDQDEDDDVDLCEWCEVEAINCICP